MLPRYVRHSKLYLAYLISAFPDIRDKRWLILNSQTKQQETFEIDNGLKNKYKYGKYNNLGCKIFGWYRKN